MGKEKGPEKNGKIGEKGRRGTHLWNSGNTERDQEEMQRSF